MILSSQFQLQSLHVFWLGLLKDLHSLVVSELLLGQRILATLVFVMLLSISIWAVAHHEINAHFLNYKYNWVVIEFLCLSGCLHVCNCNNPGQIRAELIAWSCITSYSSHFPFLSPPLYCPHLDSVFFFPFL